MWLDIINNKSKEQEWSVKKNEKVIKVYLIRKMAVSIWPIRPVSYPPLLFVYKLAENVFFQNWELIN